MSAGLRRVGTFRRSKHEWVHYAPSDIVTMVDVEPGGFLMVCTSHHGCYFLDRDGEKVDLPIPRERTV